MLTLAIHHIAFDGWSRRVFCVRARRALRRLRRGERLPLPEPDCSIADYAVWQREWLHGEALERSSPTGARLDGAPRPARSADRPAPSRPSSAGHASSASSSPPSSRPPLRELARSEGARSS